MNASTSRLARLGPVRLGAVVFAAVLAAGLLPATVAGFVGGGAQPNDRTATDQVVVRWVDGSPGTAFGADADIPSVGARPDRVADVAQATGVATTWLRTLAVGGDVYKLAGTLSPDEMASAMLSLRAKPGVAGAEPDGIAHALATAPNDPCWFGSAPCADGIGQWDLREGTTSTTYGIDLLGAWDRTKGTGVRVAVLDTGITTHPEFTGQTVAGFDFIADTTVANDGNGRDSNPADPGDNTSPYDHSSWHGTHVTGTIAALTGNGVGMAGIAPLAKIQPVRVLGVGGGYYSDISDGMVWAAGGSVTGVPANATPSRVENLSLGGSGTCPTYMQSAITAANNRGTSVVVAAGNAGSNASNFTPANCSGVVAVAATTRTGARATFSNYGSVVSIAAPGVSLWSTLNTGVTGPGNASYAQYSGTSMASPHVAGVVALMLSVKPGLTPSQVRSILQSTAHPFGSAGCSGCGAGIVDASKAVAAAAGTTPAPSPTPTPRPTATPTPTRTPTPTSTPGATPTPAPTPTTPAGCTRGTPSVTASASNVTVLRGFTKSLTLTLRNADTAGCGSSTFSWTASASPIVAGFTTTTPSSVTVNPGSSVQMTVTISAGSLLPSFTQSTFTYRATRAASPTSGQVSVAATTL